MPDGGVGGQQADQAGDDADADDGDHERLAAPDLVAHHAEDHSADRAGHESHAERGEGGHRRRGGVLACEELDVEHQRRGGAEEEEVVPFHGGADEGADGNLGGLLVGDLPCGACFECCSVGHGNFSA